MSLQMLFKDEDFQLALEKVLRRYPGLTCRKIYSVIKGESAFNPTAQNPNTKAAGLFQFIPMTASDLGYTVEEIRLMSPAQQMTLYGEYLDFWNYNPINELGIMQAAPAYANRTGNDIVYEQGTRQWHNNPGWRDENNNITVDSINAYYRKQYV